MGQTARCLTFGALLGVLFSTLRAPLGLDLVASVAVEGTSLFAFRAAALLAAGLAVARAPLFAGGVPLLKLLGSTTFGFALHGLLLDRLAPLGSRVEFAVALIGLLLALHITGRKGPAPSGEQELPRRTGPARALGLALCGAGLAIAFEAVARPLRQLGLGLRIDDVAFAVALLGSLLLGAAAFRRFFPIERHGHLVAALLAGAAVLACGLGFERLSGFGEGKLLSSFLQNVGSLYWFASGPPSVLRMDVSHLGTWRADLLIAGATFIVPGMLAGVALSGLRDARGLASLLVGAAAGTLLHLALLRGWATPRSFAELESSTHAADQLAVALYLTAAGALAVALSARSATPRTVGVTGALALAVLPSLTSPSEAWLFSPWDEMPAVTPLLTIDTPEGLLTVENVRQNPTATLDRDRLTPSPWEEDGDADRIRTALNLLEPGEEVPRVLFVGQMTPARAEAFRRTRRVALECTAPWWRHMDRLNEVLFAESDSLPFGETLELSVARERLADGAYDLVLVPPRIGRRLPTLPAQYDSAPAPAPRSHAWSVPEGTLAVVWLDTASELCATRLGERVLVSTLPFEEPCIAIVLGEPASSVTLAGGERDRWSSGLAALRLRGYQRQHRSRTRTFERIAAASEGSEGAAFGRALALHYGAQSEVSPFGNWAQGIDVTRETLAAMREATDGRAALTPAQERFWEQLALVLQRGREPDKVLEFVAPVAKEHAPWHALDRAVLAAYMEFDMEAEVETLAPRLIEAAPYDIDLLLELAGWEENRDRAHEALAYLRRADSVQPGRRDLVRRMAVLAHALDEPDAERLLRAALALDPEDHELLELLDGTP